MAPQVAKDVVQDRYDRLIAVSARTRLGENRALVGRSVEVLVATARAARTGRRIACPDGPATTGWSTSRRGTAPRPGTSSTVDRHRAAPHHLVADGAPRAVRRTCAGDAWSSRQGRDQTTERDLLGTPGGSGVSWPGPVALGMPALSRPV